MEKKNWAKRILALGTGALMLGATLTGALAATWDLEDYPAPFVQNGQLADTVLVVGKAAETADVLGAIDIAAALQASAVSEVAVDVATTVAPTSEDGLKIEKSGAPFLINEQISDIQAGLDDSDLDLLSDGVFDDRKGANKGKTDFTQTLDFGTTVDDTFALLMTQPADNKVYDDGRPFGAYLHLAKNADVYTYTFLLDSGVNVDNSADMEGNTLEIQGNTYTITEAREDTAGTGVDKLTLVAGDSTMWLVQDQPYTLGSHTVTVVDVDNDQTMCGINVDGVTMWVDQGTTQEFGDLSLGVLDVVAVYTKDYDADTCELTIGSSEIVLEDGEKVVMNDEELDGSTVTFTGSSGDWTGFTINYDAGKENTGVNRDNLYLDAGEAWTDPVFGNWKVEYAGTTAKYETLRVEGNGDDAELTFMNNDGREVTIMWNYDTTQVLGSAEDEPMLQPGDSTTQGPEGVYLLYSVTTTNEVHVLQIDELDCQDGITINDITYDRDGIADEAAFDCAVNNTVSLGSLGSINLTYVNTTNTLTFNGGLYGTGDLETEFEGVISSLTNESFIFTEVLDTVTADQVTITLAYDADDGLQVSSPSGIVTGGDADNDDDSSSFWYTAKGTTVEREEDGYWLEIMHPEEDVYGNVFVMPTDAEVTPGGSDSVSADKVNPFSVGLAVLDETAESMSKNMIIVGGPCANTIAADLMGNQEDCTEGFEAGKAMLKFFDRSGKAALLVAGFSADDTVGAAYVLADYNAYDLSGDEVEVVVTSLNEITVN